MDSETIMPEPELYKVRLSRVREETGNVAYISGPMAGMPEHGYPAFVSATSTLRHAGFVVTSPHHGGVPEWQIIDALERAGTRDFTKTRTYARLMQRDIALVLTVDVLFTLQGWGNSRGARTEVLVAQMAGIPCFDLHTAEPLKLIVQTSVEYA